MLWQEASECLALFCIVIVDIHLLFGQSIRGKSSRIPEQFGQREAESPFREYEAGRDARNGKQIMKVYFALCILGSYANIGNSRCKMNHSFPDDGPDRHVLHKVNLTLISKERCSALNNKTTSQLKNGILDDTMFCAGGRLDNDICQVTTLRTLSNDLTSKY